MKLVIVENLVKSYGSVRAVNTISLSASEGSILALAGPDGAGKTSLFRSLCGVAAFDSGEASIAGFDVKREFDKVKPVLGYMPQTFSLYPDLTVEENLRFYSGMFGQNRSEFDRRKNALYEFSGLAPFSSRHAGKLSGGMKQKLALSCALIHDPRVLILDEPTTGVDPLSRKQFWDILKELRNEGTAVLVSTPYMDEVEIADHAILIHRGRKLAEGTASELAREFQGQIFRINVPPTVRAMADIRRLSGIELRRFGSSIHAYAPPGHTIDEFRRRIASLGLPADSVEQLRPELEDLFVQLMGR